MMLSFRLTRRVPGFCLSVEASCPYPVTAVFGPSGAGKTTLLNLVAGLERPEEGEIELDGELLFSSKRKVDVPPERRRIGYVFQDDLLFPHLSVEANLRYGFARITPEHRRFDVSRIVDLLELGPLMHRMPRRLSGGERQRVALGRGILASPRLLLMDEPLSGIDTGMKNRILPYLRHIRTDLGIPMLYVSHSVGEVLQLTGQVLVLDQGRLAASGDFFDVAHRAEVRPLLDPFGFENVLPVEVVSHDPERGFTQVRYAETLLKVPACERPVGTRVFVGIRASDVILSRGRPEGLSIRNALSGRVREIHASDGMRLVSVDAGGKRLMAEVTGEAVDELKLKAGEEVTCLMKTNSFRVGPDVT